MKATTLPIALALAFTAGYATPRAVPNEAPPAAPKSQDPPGQNPPDSKGQDPKGQNPNTTGGATGSPTVDPAMARARQMALTMPGRQHLQLGNQTGHWAVNIAVMRPGMPRQVTTASAVIRQILGGRFLWEQLNGQLGGKDYQARAISGFDPFQQTHFSIWMDNLSLIPHISSGDAKPGQMDLKGVRRDWEVPNGKPYRTETRIGEQARTMVRRVYEEEDGRETLVMEMTYKRNK
ncbi:MAG: DUF1579 family protein [Planctomycetota bacterium]